MYIPFQAIAQYAALTGKPIRGVLHIGAHECEEKGIYNACGIPDSTIVWIEGNTAKVEQMRQLLPTSKILCALVDETERQVKFNITSNSQSSSILELGTHATRYPSIVVTEEEIRTTTSLATLIQENHLDIQSLNFWNLDIQGAELAALQGARDFLQYADYIYCEVNVEPLYKGCALMSDIDAFLASKGFRREVTNLLDDGWGDAVYVRYSPPL